MEGTRTSNPRTWPRRLRAARRELGPELPDLSHPGSHTALLHSEAETPSAPLTAEETDRWRRIRHVGLVGTLLVTLGGLAAGAHPVNNWLLGRPILGILPRISAVGIPLVFVGAFVLLCAWLALGRLCFGMPNDDGTTRRVSRGQLDRTLIVWTLPLLVVPPLFSKDVYSYVAIGLAAAYGEDPYSDGPYNLLDGEGPLAANVPGEWRGTPAQYGPGFLLVARLIAFLTRENAVAGILLHRLVAIGGILLAAWAIPRIARRCSVAGVNAMWLGLLNPLVFLHLIGGVHNEALMLGVMMVGLEFGLRGMEALSFPDRESLRLITLGTAIIAFAATIKISALFALAFLGVGVARALRRGKRAVPLVAGAMGLVVGVVFVITSISAGVGTQWLRSTGAASTIESWTSLPTLMGIIAGAVGRLLGLGDHTSSDIEVARALAVILAALFALRALWGVWEGRTHVMGGFGVSMLVAVILFPVVHAWYILWALVPLATWASTRKFRLPAVIVSAVFSFVVFPAGGWVHPGVALQMVIYSVLFCVVALVLVRRYVTLDGHAAGNAPRVA